MSNNPMLGYTDALLIGMLNEWVEDQRMRETWHDGDKATYRYRANLLEAASNRIRNLRDNHE